MGAGKSKEEIVVKEREEPHDTITYAEYWFRPLLSKVAQAFGGKHSFVTMRTKSRQYWFVEKLHDGQVTMKALSNSEYIKLKTSGHERRHVAHKASIKPGVTLRTITRVAEEHAGEYHIHDANCHRLSTAIWNALMKENKVSIPQQKLTGVCKQIGIGEQNGMQSSRSGVP